MDDIDEAVAELYPDTQPEQQLVPQELFNELRDPNLTKIRDPELERVVREIECIAFANIADIWESELVIDMGSAELEARPRLSLKDITELPRELSAAIQSIKVKDGDVEIKMYSKLDAQEKLMKHLGGYAKENAQKAVAHEKLMDLLFMGAEASGMPVPTSNDA